jgi:hypothetical protein
VFTSLLLFLFLFHVFLSPFLFLLSPSTLYLHAPVNAAIPPRRAATLQSALLLAIPRRAICRCPHPAISAATTVEAPLSLAGLLGIVVRKHAAEAEEGARGSRGRGYGTSCDAQQSASESGASLRCSGNDWG